MHKQFKALLVVSILAGAAVFTIGVVSSCSSTNKTTAPASRLGSSAEPLKVEPVTLVAEFDDNRINAKDKYNGKVVQTSGFIWLISNARDSFYLRINPTSEQDYTGTYFSCFVSKEDAAAVANGQAVSFKGTVDDDYASNIQMKDCSVVK